MANLRQSQKCPRCENAVLNGKYKCGKCGTWVLTVEKSTKTKSYKTEDDGSVLLSDVTSAAAARIHTPMCGLIWGRSVLEDKKVVTGMVNTSVTLLGGNKGAGKSTLVLQLMGQFAEVTGRESLYITCEQANPEVKLNADRIKIPNQNRIRMVEALSGTSNVASIIENRKPGAAVIDSLRGMVGDDSNLALEACKLCKVLAVEYECPIIVIQHVTKQEEIAGSNDDQHEVDTVMILTAEGGKGDLRSLYVEKNRFGQAHITQQFRMTEFGMELSGQVLQAGWDEVEEDDEED